MKRVILTATIGIVGFLLFFPPVYEQTANVCTALEAHAGSVAYNSVAVSSHSDLPRFVASLGCAVGYWRIVLSSGFSLSGLSG